jgi:hypothetical protein
MPGQRRTKRNCFSGRPFGYKVIGQIYLLPEELNIREALDAVLPPGGDLR